MLAERTERNYGFYVARWERAGCPEPVAWVGSLPSPALRRIGGAALRWHFRVHLGRTLETPPVRGEVLRVPQAFTDAELARVFARARGLHVEPVFRFLYGTGARVNEACSVLLEDVTATHVVLRNTKRRAGSGMQIERAIPLSDMTRKAVLALRENRRGRQETLLGARVKTVQKWCQWLEAETGIRVHAHKFRSTFITHMLQRGVPIHECQRLAGHADIETTLRYAAVTDERLIAAVQVLS